MRIALDRKQLLGFGTGRGDLEVPDFGVPVTASKVGTKGTIVPSTSHDGLIETLCPPTPAALAYPA